MSDKPYEPRPEPAQGCRDVPGQPPTLPPGWGCCQCKAWHTSIRSRCGCGHDRCVQVPLPTGIVVAKLMWRGSCPFCTGTATVFDSDAASGVLHTKPYCERFDRMEPDDFVEAMRREKQQQLGGPMAATRR